MPFQGCISTVLLSNGRAKGPKNLLVRFDGHAEPVVMSGGHLNKYTDENAANGLPHYAKRNKKNTKGGKNDQKRPNVRKDSIMESVQGMPV